jgi:hypothetical protein
MAHAPTDPATLAVIAATRLGLAFETDRLALFANELVDFDDVLTAARPVAFSLDPTTDHRLRLVRAAGE